MFRWLVFGSVIGILSIIIGIVYLITRMMRKGKVCGILMHHCFISFHFISFHIIFHFVHFQKKKKKKKQDSPPSSMRGSGAAGSTRRHQQTSRSPPDVRSETAGPHSGAEADEIPPLPALVPANRPGRGVHAPLEADEGEAGGGSSGASATPGRLRPRYSRFPNATGKVQRRVLVWSHVSLIVLFFITITIFYASDLRTYQIWGREEGRGIGELTPNMVVTKTNMLLYAFPGVASTLRMNIFNVWLTNSCGRRFIKELSPEEKRVEILRNFINLYDIDMELYERPFYYQYTTVNDWFSRALAPGKRTIADVADRTAISSPADARIVVYQDVTANVKVWLKGQKFTAAKLLDSTEHAASFEGGSLVIVRLAPQDYHRFHAPVSGVIIDQYPASGPLHSVNADGMRSANGAIFNKRVVSIIQTDFGKVGFVAIGAVCVGSITMTAPKGYNVTRGESIGYFEFGGSTVALMFEKGKATFAADLITASGYAVENLVKMGMTLAKFN
jgi:phosphatidylserine decarboxylase precursor